MTQFLNLAVQGLLVGGIYSLFALGFVLIYKSSRVLNFAQGEFLLLGAFVVWSLTVQLGAPLPLAILLSFGVALALGLGVERLMLRPLIGQPILGVIMATLGLAFILRGLWAIIWGAWVRAYPPLFPLKPLNLGGVLVGLEYLWGFVASMAFLGLFALFFKYSRRGLAMRVTADDQDAARSMGVVVKRVFAMAWVIAAMVAMMGGFFLGTIQGLNFSLAGVGLKAFPVVILGGMESIVGLAIAGPIIGMAESLAGGYLDGLVGGGIKEVLPFVIMVIILIIRPYGLFGWKEIERV